MNLYSIANKYQELFRDAVDHETGEINEEKFNEIAVFDRETVLSVAAHIGNLNVEREAIAKAKLELQRREERLDKIMKPFQDYLITNMARQGITEISCPEFVIKLKKCPWSTEIINEEFIPEKYKKHKDVVTLDRLKIKEDILAGVDIPGASIKQNNRLEIR